MAKKVIGLENVMKNLNKEIRKIKNRSAKGLIKAAIIIRRDMDKTAPKIPIDWGNLRASWFVTSGRGEVKQAGGSSGSFKGKKASELSADHSRVTNSATSKAQGHKDPIVVMGFSANYSGYVHEKQGTKMKRQGSGPQFFKSSIDRNKLLVLQTVADNAKL